MSIKLQQARLSQIDILFLLRNSLNNLTLSVNNLINPVSRISEDARKHLNFEQQVALENSFSLHTYVLKRQPALLMTQLAEPEGRIFANLHRIKTEDFGMNILKVK
jgi:hypothetical protein